MATRGIADVVFGALQNERSLDLYFRQHAAASIKNHPAPNYKLMKQVALAARLGVFYWPFISIARLLMPLVSMAEWGAALLFSLAGAKPRAATIHVIATVPSNLPLVRPLAEASTPPDAVPYDSDVLGLRPLSVAIGPMGVFRCGLQYLALLRLILGTEPKVRSDLLLHNRDAMVLLMLALYCRMNPGHVFLTDDHYQRWSFILSHTSRHLVIVQHGYLYANIEFAAPFGTVETLNVRDPVFVDMFRSYYTIEKWQTFKYAPPLTTYPLPRPGVFIASSFPAIDQEITVAKLLKERGDVSIIVKFHPAHEYDGRKADLATLADVICASHEFPACEVFISYNSFLDYDYRSHGVPTLSIAEHGAVQTVERACAIIGASK